MEMEMKFSIKDKDRAETIWEDEYLQEIGEPDSRETVRMKAAYFDTDDYVLSKNDIAFRVRMEGSRIVASLKWNGSYADGLHTREEINVPISEEACLIMPSPDIFRESEQGKAMMELIGDKKLHSLMEVVFVRRRMRVDSGDAISEVAIDTGEILTDYGSKPLCELEIELFSGEAEAVVKLGKSLASKYELEPEHRSKYARGLDLLQQDLEK